MFSLVVILMIIGVVGKNPEFLAGVIVLVIGTAAGWVAWKVYHVRRLRKSGIKDIDDMEGHKFERYLGVLFKALGYKSVVTRASGDFGADLVIEKDGKRIVVQAKRYSGNVGIKAVQEVHAAIPFYHADEGWVVTNQSYTDAAKRLAGTNGVRLIDRQELIRLSLQVQRMETASTVDTSQSQDGKS